MGEEDLKECPFCGSRDVELNTDWDDNGCTCCTVFCNNCSAMTRPEELPTHDDGSLMEEGDEEFDDLVDNVKSKWNRRSNSSALSKEVLSLADMTLFHAKTLANSVNSGQAYIEELIKLTSKISDLKQQIDREDAEIKKNIQVDDF